MKKKHHRDMSLVHLVLTKYWTRGCYYAEEVHGTSETEERDRFLFNWQTGISYKDVPWSGPRQMDPYDRSWHEVGDCPWGSTVYKGEGSPQPTTPHLVLNDMVGTRYCYATRMNADGSLHCFADSKEYKNAPEDTSSDPRVGSRHDLKDCPWPEYEVRGMNLFYRMFVTKG
ncbi:hypothetical protein [Streptomyces sp. bgisy091]|uniref:hypothetical protein n=1 Tax=Streptomyces sp. bgisy091 TaxID=3413778 RepID=UPI003D752CFD